MKYLCHKWPRMCSIRRKNFRVLSSFITYHRICNQINMTDTTSGAGTATLSEHMSSPPVFIGVRLGWCVCFEDRCLSFFFWPLCCLSFDLIKDSDYAFAIFKLFVLWISQCSLLVTTVHRLSGQYIVIFPFHKISKIIYLNWYGHVLLHSVILRYFL